MRTAGRLLFVLSLLAATVGMVNAATAEAELLDPPSETCTDDGAATDPTCVPTAPLAHGARQACDYAFLPGCDLTAFTDPGYAVATDPSPDGAFTWKVGAVHEHSGYSDGAPDSVPRDYFTAARDGVNEDGTGVRLDFLFSSEHSDNAQMTVTTNAGCLAGPTQAAECTHLDDNTFWWKWPAALRQARETSTARFTAMRGFEWTNDFYNHMNVYFSTNYRNVKVDGSYLTMDRMWEWLQSPVEEGGGADGLVTFNHPGSDPKLSPFDGDLPHSGLLAENTTLDNWDEVAYVPAVDDRVIGMEINGGEDIEWYVRALTNGWHIGALAAEDHHERSWASTEMNKTMVLTRGSTPQDYYWALANRRTVAVHDDFVGGAPGQRAVVPTIALTADRTHLLGSRVPNGDGAHSLAVQATGLPSGSRVALVGSPDALTAPIQLGTANAAGWLDGHHTISSAAPSWWFALVCPPAAPDAPACGTDFAYGAVTAPIWFE